MEQCWQCCQGARAQGVASLVLNIWTRRLMETSDKMQSRQIVFLLCHSFANYTKQIHLWFIYLYFLPLTSSSWIVQLQTWEQQCAAPGGGQCPLSAPVPRQWSDALYSVSELQPKYVPAAAQSALELSMGRLSAMIITHARIGYCPAEADVVC